MNKVSEKCNSALVLFSIALILYVIALFTDSPNLDFFCRPVIIPSIFFYYYVRVRGNVNLLFTLSILSYFIGEILYLISEKDFLEIGLIFFVIPYFITTYFLYQDFSYYLKKRKHKTDRLSFFIVFLLLIYLLYNVLSFISDASQFEFGLYVVFGVLLFVMTSLAFLIQLNHPNRTILFTILMVISFLISDIFFVFSIMMKEVFSLKIINVVAQQLSYFLFVCYFINRTNYKLWKKS